MIKGDPYSIAVQLTLPKGLKVLYLSGYVLALSILSGRGQARDFRCILVDQVLPPIYFCS